MGGREGGREFHRRFMDGPPLTVFFNRYTTRHGRRMREGGQLSPQPRTWEANKSFCPTQRNLDRAPRKNCRKCKEQHYNYYTAGENRASQKNRGPSAPQGGPRRFRGPRKLVCFPSNWFAPPPKKIYTTSGNQASHKNRGPSASKRAPPIQGT